MRVRTTFTSGTFDSDVTGLLTSSSIEAGIAFTAAVFKNNNGNIGLPKEMSVKWYMCISQLAGFLDT